MCSGVVSLVWGGFEAVWGVSTVLIQSSRFTAALRATKTKKKKQIFYSQGLKPVFPIAKPVKVLFSCFQQKKKMFHF